MVIRKITYLEYYIQKDVNSRPFTVHADDMKLFEGPRHPESWLNEVPIVEQPLDVMAPRSHTPERSAGATRETLPGPEMPNALAESPQSTPLTIRTKRGWAVKPPKSIRSSNQSCVIYIFFLSAGSINV